jgi:hypothetical protein
MSCVPIQFSASPYPCHDPHPVHCRYKLIEVAIPLESQQAF